MKESLFGQPLQARALARARQALGAPDGRGKTAEDRYILKMLETRSRHAETRKTVRLNRAMKPKAASNLEWKKLRDEADRVFSLHVRIRDTQLLEGTETRVGVCITCGTRKVFGALECGHWLSRKEWGTRWHEFNAHAQCAGCNKWGGGRADVHEKAIIIRHGQEWPDKLRALAKFKARKPTIAELQAIIKEFKDKPAK